MDNLITRAREEIKPDADIIILSIVSAILATFGIILKDNFILLASMLVSPFFDAIISFVVFVKVGDLNGIWKSVKTFLLIFAIGLITSTAFSALLSINHDLTDVSYLPNIRIEYFLVALTLGMVGMLLWMWPKMSNTSAGLAIAISLMPPLANVGRSIILLNSTKFFSSVGSFFINVIGIIIGAILVLFLKKSK